MKVRANVTFCGVVAMRTGEVKDIDPALAGRLASVNYVEILDKPEILEKKEKEETKENESKNQKARNVPKRRKR